MNYLPVCKKDLEERGIEQLDFILVSGDAYVDHPSFGISIIGRLLESRGYTVGIIAQPDWKDLESFKIFGLPRLSFLVSGGNIDSMVNHYTVAKKPRSRDYYSPGGQMGLRPDRATIVYSNKIREAYKDASIILGGIEASLRRLSHYDYWDNKVRRSILLDSSADLLIYGMAEHQIIEVAEALESGIEAKDICYISGCVYKTADISSVQDYIILPSYKEVSEDKIAYCKSFLSQYENTDSITAKTLIEPYGNFYVVQTPPSAPITTSEFDNVYSLNYERNYHPMYEKDGGIPAIEEVKFSIISNRGCYGNCNFCALAFHQGRVVQARSHQSILSEAKNFVWEPDFKGYIHDVGGPTANFRMPACKKQLKYGACKDRQCLFPDPCPNLDISHKDYLSLLRKLRNIEGIKKVFVRSGLRYDYLIHDKDDEFFKELCMHHISGQLKVAPEHISKNVLEKMGKPQKEVYFKFTKKYADINKALNKNQFIVPYLMSSHPGSDLSSAVELAEYLRDLNYTPEQVQDFYPTPGTLSTCIYYTGIDPRTMEKVYVPKSPHEKAMQRALMQYRLPKNYDLVKEALMKAGRQDLIGFDKKCLIRPRTTKREAPEKKAPEKKKSIRNVHRKKN
ncbi:YgiQ family radical SAM protein [Anaeropeptidivorans aminofermentans]|uniref:YgiQ family radical SAM protein n=1 Tax=Anaeropeptidivorans aminofermentans TaxID=2934315 RepID=UPI002024ED2B|nr:YgiQ family radical SAM protein [Anaeropeptidivorans aminofermentans]